MENQKLTPQVFEHSHFGKLRVILIDGVVYFVGRDVAKALGYKDIKNALRRHVDPKDKLRVKVFTPSQRREMIVINKSGVYSLVLDSQLPLAKEYRHWVMEEVAKSCENILLPLANDAPQVFTHPKFGSLHVVFIDGIPYFVGIDVARALEYQNGSRDIERHVDERDRLTRKIYWAGQRREMIVINKSGVYSLVLDSQLPLAKEYRHWVTSVVLPKVDEQGFFVREEVVGENISLAEFNALKEQVLGLTATFNQWLADMQKQLTPCQRADKLLALADKIHDDEARDKILLKAANLLIGKHIF